MMLTAMATLTLVAAEPTVHALTFSGPRTWTFDARLVEPAGSRSGLTVLLIGGGLGNDLDWSVPGSIEWNGTTTQMTIDGTTHRDAPRIAAALTSHGHAVVYYSTIAQEDPKRDRWPLEMTLLSPAELLALAQQAADMIRLHPLTKDDALVLLAHSMGAQRACAQAATDASIKALVLLGAAQMTRTGPDDPGRNLHRQAAMQRIHTLDVDGNGIVEGTEVPEAIDFDGDGVLRAWEVAADMATKARASITTKKPDKSGMPFGEDSLQLATVPTLVLYGGLDEAQACHAPVLQSLAHAGTLKHVRVSILPDIGHQLGPELDGRFGPISNAALGRIVAHVNAQAHNDTTDTPSVP
jgi:pimeloyl-ACP methyl ester carboxylesterase